MKTEDQIRKLQQENKMLKIALRGLLDSYEAYCYLYDPKSPEDMDEYDEFMKPRWELAKRVLEENAS